MIFPARELLPTDEVRARAAALVREQPWGAAHWERLAEGQSFDGMESWLPWLCEREHLLSDLLPPEALVLLCEPRRIRDRAQELLDDEAALAATLATTWGADGDDAPRLSLPFDRLLAHTAAGATNVLSDARVARHPAAPGDRLRSGGRVAASGSASGSRSCGRDGYRVVLAADGTGERATPRRRAPRGRRRQHPRR